MVVKHHLQTYSLPLWGYCKWSSGAEYGPCSHDCFRENRFTWPHRRD